MCNTVGPPAPETRRRIMRQALANEVFEGVLYFLLHFCHTVSIARTRGQVPCAKRASQTAFGFSALRVRIQVVADGSLRVAERQKSRGTENERSIANNAASRAPVH